MHKHLQKMAWAGLLLLLVVASPMPARAAAQSSGPTDGLMPPLPSLKTLQELSVLSQEARVERIRSDPQFAEALRLLQSPDFQARLQKAWQTPRMRWQVWQTYKGLRQAMPAILGEAGVVDEQLPNFLESNAAEGSGNNCDFSKATHGDILVSYNRILGFFPVFWAKNWDHAGFMNDYATGECFEAQFGGVKVRRNLADWQAADHAGVYRLREDPDGVIAAKAYDFAFRQFNNKPYNFNWLDMNREDAAYCSQLVWYGYNKAGRNLDSNTHEYWLFLYSMFNSILLNNFLSSLMATITMYIVVSPDELTMSPLVEEVSRD